MQSIFEIQNYIIILTKDLRFEYYFSMRIDYTYKTTLYIIL